jgi:hypothetical protein
MTDSEKQSWEKIRAEGRDRFLLKSIARSRWILFGGLLVEICWWLFTGKLTKPMWEIAVGWILVALGTGASVGFLEWNTNEQKYQESRNDSPAS